MTRVQEQTWSELTNITQSRWEITANESWEYVGETKVWTNGRPREEDKLIFHADKYCINFPVDTVYVIPISVARESEQLRPCMHCTIQHD